MRLALMACACSSIMIACDAIRPQSEPAGPPPPETLTISASPNVFADASAQLSAPELPRATSAHVTTSWSSTDPRIALVDQNGMIVGRAPGTVVVRASVAGLSSVTTVQVVPATDSSIRIIAHRGFMRRFPENTIVAVRGSFDQGADAVEVDIRLSADDVPVVMHDETVDRTTNGHGSVRSMTAAELVALDACARAAGHPPPCPLPLMSDVLREAHGRGGVLLHLYGSYTADDLDRMLAAVRDADMRRETIFISFDYDLLQLLRQRDPVVALGLLTTDPTEPEFIDALGRMAPILELQSAAANPALTRAYLSDASRRRHDVGVWVAWHQEQARQAVALGFRTIIADVPIDRASLLP